MSAFDLPVVRGGGGAPPPTKKRKREETAAEVAAKRQEEFQDAELATERSNTAYNAAMFELEKRQVRMRRLAIMAFVVLLAINYFEVYRVYNSNATGHMISVIDKARAHAPTQVEHGGMAFALAHKWGWARSFIFGSGSEGDFAEAVVLAFLTKNSDIDTQSVMVGNGDGADAARYIAQMRSVQVDTSSHNTPQETVCQVLAQAAHVADSKTCHNILCGTVSGGIGGSIIEGVSLGVNLGFGASATGLATKTVQVGADVAKEADPMIIVPIMLVGAIFGFMNDRSQSCRNPSVCQC